MPLKHFPNTFRILDLDPTAPITSLPSSREYNANAIFNNFLENTLRSSKFSGLGGTDTDIDWLAGEPDEKNSSSPIVNIACVYNSASKTTTLHSALYLSSTKDKSGSQTKRETIKKIKLAKDVNAVTA